MIQTIKIENWFGSEGSNIEDGVQDGRHSKAKFNLITVDNYFPKVFVKLFFVFVLVIVFINPYTTFQTTFG